MNRFLNRREFAKVAVGAGALAATAGEAPAAKSRMYVSLNGALFNGKLRWPEFARVAARTGYRGADFDLGTARKEGLESTLALVKEAKLRLAACGLPVNLTRGDDAAFQAGLRELGDAAKFAAAAGCPRMTTVISPAGQTPKEEMRKRLKDRLTAVGEVLQGAKVRLGLEFLGPLQFRQRAPHVFIYRMDEMLAFAKECGPNIGLLLDSWHWHHAGATVADILAAGKSRIVTVHVSDCGKMAPEDVRDNQRLMPGEGVIDLVGFFKALQKIGYEDGISPEVIGRIPADMPQEEAARLGLETTMKVMRQAGVA